MSKPPTIPATEPDAWEIVIPGTNRLRVPGGWLYSILSFAGVPAMAFVPAEPPRDEFSASAPALMAALVGLVECTDKTDSPAYQARLSDAHAAITLAKAVDAIGRKADPAQQASLV